MTRISAMTTRTGVMPQPGSIPKIPRMVPSLVEVPLERWAGEYHFGRVSAPARQASSFRLSAGHPPRRPAPRSEEHTSELQSQSNLVCRLLLEKKKKKPRTKEYI